MSDLSSGSLWRYSQASRYLLKYYGADRPLDSITPGDANDFRRWLLKQPNHLHKHKTLGENTARTHCKKAKEFFQAAVDKKLIAENPFRKMKNLNTKAMSDRLYFVTRDEAVKVLDACPNAEWQLIFALARFGGIRIPSELLALRLADIDWANERFAVHSPKTEHNDGGGLRYVPIFPELRPYLEEVWEAAEPGTEFLIARYRSSNANLRTQLERIIHRAGLKPWPKPFQNCRSTRETELLKLHPMPLVCRWIGNSPRVAMQNYFQVTGEDYAMAANPTQPLIATATPKATDNAECNAVATQNTTQQPSASFGEYAKESAQPNAKYAFTPKSANGCEYATNEGNIPDRDRTVRVSSGNTRVCNPGNAECNAELAELLKTWPALSQAIKAGILAMIRTASDTSR